MGKPRFIYSNMITDDGDITVYSLRPGMVTSALKEGTGSAILLTQGSYTGTIDREYIVEIDSIAGGAEVGQATFKWSDGSGGWNASGVATATTQTLLNNGVYISFTSGAGADFVLGDKWYFKGINLFGVANLINMDRDARYRTNTLADPEYFYVDLLSAQAPQVLVLQDHNISFGATVTLEGDSANTFDSGGGGAAEVSEAVNFTSPTVHYLTATTPCRYWRVKITDTTNADGYIEVGTWFLGSYFEPSRSYGRTPSKPFEFLFDSNETRHGIRHHRYFNKRRKFSYEFSFLTLADMEALKNMCEHLNSPSSGLMMPFFFNEDSASPEKSWMVTMYSLDWQRLQTGTEYYSCVLTLDEVVAAT